MVEKFCDKDAKKGNFIMQMEFRKKLNKSLADILFMNQESCLIPSIMQE